MRAVVLYAAGDVRVEHVPDPVIREPTDALVRVTTSCICGSDLHPYGAKPADTEPTRIGHEFIGVIDDVGSAVGDLKRGDLVLAPFAFSDGTCRLCEDGLPTSCAQGGMWGRSGIDGGQGEAVRVPYAEANLVKLPGGVDPTLIPSLLALSDVYPTGHHAAVTGRVRPGSSVTVIGDGAVGLLAAMSAKRLGAEQIILMGRHRVRTDLGLRFGVTDVVAERGEEGIARVRELTGGQGTHVVLEAVGHRPAYDQALGVVRPGGVISRVGLPQYDIAPLPPATMWRANVTLTGGLAPARVYIDHLLPDVLDGLVEPGLVFDSSTDLDGVPAGYAAMAARSSLKVLVKP